MFVVLAILVSACVALYETIQRFLHPEHLSHLGILAAAGLAGFAGNDSLPHACGFSGGSPAFQSPALIADGNHARVDGYVSLGVVASAACIWWPACLPIADPLIEGFVITLVILKITWDSWRLVSTTEPGEMVGHRH